MGWLRYFIAAACVSVVVFFGFGSYLFWVTAQAEEQIAPQVATVLTNVNKAAVDLTRPCTPIVGQQLTVDNVKDCGTLAYANVVMQTAKGTLGQVEAGLKKNSQATEDLHNTQVAVAGAVTQLGNSGEKLGSAAEKIGTLASKLSTTVDQVNDKDNGIGATLTNINSGVTDFKGYMKSQAMQTLATNFNRTLQYTGDTMQNVAGITGDIRTQTQKMNAPKTKTQKLLQWAPPLVKVGVTVTCALLGPC